MASTRRLSKLFVDFVSETDKLLLAFECPNPKVKQTNVHWPEVTLNVAEGCAIRLYDSWNRFCRELILQSASELPTTAAGVIVPQAPTISRRADVLPTLLSKLKRKPSYGEPRWADASECLTAAKLLSLSNYSTVSAAIGATPSPAEDIRKTRNFIAHRNVKTGIELRAVISSYGVGTIHVEQLLRHTVHSGITVLGKWVEELRLLAEAAVQ